MAAKPPSKGAAPKKSRRRLYIALGIVLAAVVAYYLYERYQSNAGLSSVIPQSSNNAQTPTPTSDTGSGSGTGTPVATPGPDFSGLLSTLAGENQSLLNGLLASEQGLASLAGASVGAPTATAQPVAEPTTINVTIPQNTSTPVATSKPAATPDTVAATSAALNAQAASTEQTETPADQAAAQVPAASPEEIAARSASYEQLVAPKPKPVNPAPSGSGAGAVAAGTEKKNYQAAARAA